MVTIERVDARSTQGVLHPFLCTAENGTQYFVKGKGAGRSSLIAEWLAGHLGHFLNLPIPPFEAVHVPPTLVENSAFPGIADLGKGLCFGSQRVPFVQELGPSHLQKVPKELQLGVLIFDWWIQNEDRIMVEGTGNPNLLWDPSALQMTVIDHNLAFDPEPNETQFWESHVFRASRFAVTETELDWWRVRLTESFEQFDKICATLPEEWSFEDSMQTVKANFDLERAREILIRFRAPSFWSKFSS